MTSYARLMEKIALEPAINTHDHLMPPAVARLTRASLVDLIEASCLLQDLVVAGMPMDEEEKRRQEPAYLTYSWSLPQRERRPAPAWEPDQRTEAERWQRLRPFLPKVRNTANYRLFVGALHDLYGLEGDLDDGNWQAISAQVRANAGRAEWYRTVLKERARIEVTLLDIGALDLEREFFVPVMRLDPFFFGHGEAGRREIARQFGHVPETLAAYLALLEESVEAGVAQGAVAIKQALAYVRTLSFEEVSRAEAERIYGKRNPDAADARRFEDYIMHAIVQLAIERRLPLQVHTGLQASYGNIIEHTNPLGLNRLILKYPEARFDLFHGGYPYIHEITALAKICPNVYLNLCWLPPISPTVAANCLREWLEMVPGNKILWGADTSSVEECYGVARAGREVLARVLAEEVDSGYLNVATALDLAKMILHDNAQELYRLGQG